jgi:TolA-binding protein
MIMSGKTPRTISRRGRLAVLAVGALLLPLVPSWAQQDPVDRTSAGKVKKSGQQSPILYVEPIVVPQDAVVTVTGFQPVDQRSRQAREKARADLEAAQAQLKEAQRNLEQMQRQILEASQRFEQARSQFEVQKQRLTQLELEQGYVPGPSARGKTILPREGTSGDFERRLEVLEGRLEQAMAELRGLRRDMKSVGPK